MPLASSNDPNSILGQALAYELHDANPRTIAWLLETGFESYPAALGAVDRSAGFTLSSTARATVSPESSYLIVPVAEANAYVLALLLVRSRMVPTDPPTFSIFRLALKLSDGSAVHISPMANPSLFAICHWCFGENGLDRYTTRVISEEGYNLSEVTATYCCSVCFPDYTVSYSSSFASFQCRCGAAHRVPLRLAPNATWDTFRFRCANSFRSFADFILTDSAMPNKDLVQERATYLFRPDTPALKELRNDLRTHLQHTYSFLMGNNSPQPPPGPGVDELLNDSRAPTGQTEQTNTWVPSAENNSNFACTACSKTFANGFTLRRHEQTVHQDPPRLQCDFCPAHFTQRGNLDRHISSMHSGPDADAHQCKLCDARFARSSNLSRHVRSYHRQDPAEVTRFPQEPSV